MMASSPRKILSIVGLLAVVTVFLLLDTTLSYSFVDTASISGIILFVLLCFLMLFSVRKRLSFLPLLPASQWLKAHTYVGILAFFVFLAHNGTSLPHGGLEQLLAAFFVITGLSGIGGLILSRALPARLTAHGENLNFERIPALCEELRQEVQELIISSAEDTNSSTIADFYEANLAPYFAAPQPPLGSLFQETRVPRKLTEGLDGLKRYLNEEEEKTAEELIQLVLAKQNLDVQWNLQSVLKFWLFVHIPLSFGLMVLAVAHIVLVWKFL